AAAIEAFLPAGGTGAALTANATNPTTSSAGVFASQVLAVRLAVDFSNAGVLKKGLGGLVVVSGPLQGKTVNQVLAIANGVLGGAAPPAGVTISDLIESLTAINENFVDGVDNQDLACATNVAPVASPDSFSVKKGQTKTVAVLQNDSDANGDPLVLAGGTQPTRGSVTFNADGTVTFTAPSTTGTTTFTYVISDGRGGTATATVTVTITN
ncbi:MAG TPA: Ig-like domain-containing protein, partial [Vicinamibacterales bacterium]|nr:Ig-like domain-containing protein [Vicinamibacterales bacterium]